MVVRDAQSESVCHLLVVGGSRRTEQARGQIYVAVFSSPASQDDFAGRRRFERRRDCSTAGHPLVRVAPGLFPPELVVQVKAWACELPATHELPLSRWSTRDLVREVRRSGLVASIGGSTLWRWLHQDAIRPWYHRSWIFPRDPGFAEKAGRLLDLYARQWQSKPLKDDEFVISADEKTSIQARVRKHPTRSCRPRRSMRVEHAYQRGGAWVYLSALDVPFGASPGARPAALCFKFCSRSEERRVGKECRYRGS